MRLFFVSVLLVLFTPQISFCQSWEEMNTLVLKLTQEQRYDSALSLAKKAISLAEKELGKISLAYSATLNNIAVIYMNLAQFVITESFALESTQLVRKM